MMLDSYDDGTGVQRCFPAQSLLTSDPFDASPPPPTDVTFRACWNSTTLLATSAAAAATASDSEDPRFQLRYGPLASVAIALIAAVLATATSGGNLLVIAAFRVDSQLQRVSNYFLLSLAVADFAIGAVSMPLFAVYLLLGRWPLGK